MYVCATLLLVIFCGEDFNCLVTEVSPKIFISRDVVLRRLTLIAKKYLLKNTYIFLNSKFDYSYPQKLLEFPFYSKNRKDLGKEKFTDGQSYFNKKIRKKI